MKQNRPYLVARDNKILVLYIGSKTQEPLAPKEIANKLSLSRWVVYRTIARLGMQGFIPKNNLVSPERIG